MLKPTKADVKALKAALTKAELKAIDHIGLHRKTLTRVGPRRPVSKRTFNSLRRKGLVMWLDEKKQIVMLTYPGERVFTTLHPYSKYRIK